MSESEADYWLNALCTVMELAPGDPVAYIRALLCPDDAEYVIRHYYSTRSIKEPEALRA